MINRATLSKKHPNKVKHLRPPIYLLSINAKTNKNAGTSTNETINKSNRVLFSSANKKGMISCIPPTTKLIEARIIQDLHVNLRLASLNNPNIDLYYIDLSKF